jgi:hypothetical protein
LKIRHIPEGQPIPEWFLDTLQESLSQFASPNFEVSIFNNTTLQVVAGDGSNERSIAIGAPDNLTFGMRMITATVQAAAPGSLIVGDNDVYVLAHANSFVSNPTPPPHELDSTDYSFTLAILPPTQTPSGVGAQAYYRKVAVATWDGAKFTDVRNLLGATAFPRHAASHNPGGADALAWGTVLGAGTLAARPAASSANANLYYFASDASGGTLYRSNGSAWVQLAAGLTQAPNAHAAAHLAGGADAIAWATVNGVGTLAARPSAAGKAGYTYLATDVNSGTTYRSDGAVWLQQGAGSAQGYFLKQIIALSAGATYTPGSDVRALFVECIAGGGGGGGSSITGVGAVSVGGGGGGGGYAAAFLTALIQGVHAIAVGGGGGGGAAGANPGSAGDDTTFADTTGSVVVRAKGGAGGGAGNAPVGAPALGGAGGGGGPVAGAVGAIEEGGQPGQAGMALTNIGLIGGGGGSAAKGGGGGGQVGNQTNGAAGNSPGGGGGGAASGSSGANRPGGNGAQGIIIIWEFV